METVTVDAKALGIVLQAFMGARHEVLELKVLFDFSQKFPTGENPISTLIQNYNDAVDEFQKNMEAD